MSLICIIHHPSWDCAAESSGSFAEGQLAMRKWADIDDQNLSLFWGASQVALVVKNPHLSMQET